MELGTERCGLRRPHRQSLCDRKEWRLMMDLFKSRLRAMTKDQSRDTGMAMVLLLLILYVSLKREGLLLAAMVLHVVNMTWPQIYKPMAVVWLGLSNLLGAIASKVVLGIVFFGVVTPIGVLRRLAGKDSLDLRVFKCGEESVMVTRNHTFTGSDIERPY